MFEVAGKQAQAFCESNESSLTGGTHNGCQGLEDGHGGVDEPIWKTAEYVGQPIYENLSV